MWRGPRAHGTGVFGLRIDRDLLERFRGHAAGRGMGVRGHAVQTLVRDDSDQRFRAAAEETEKFREAT
ncbi:ribbon-helix-helix protein, CopG family [Streptomyces pimonensis]|uniref:Ribbon-helix-helix protein, CopG family n=1 Tax=Streptomyces pimonensis TaxID=2860288 RepID=A0ABV4IUK6_9ACTN